VVLDLDSGVPGIRFRPGDHICAFHFGGAERDHLVRAFLQAGMRAGEKCLGIVDGGDPDAVHDALCAAVGCTNCEDWFAVERADDVYLAGGGFSKEAMLAYLDAAATAAVDEGDYPCWRIVGEMSWVLRHPGLAGELFAYESAVNDIADRHSQVLMCLYDLERFGADMLIDILRTHPKLLLGGLLIDNPNYLTPAEYRSRRA
jgi:hypothetical protein